MTTTKRGTAMSREPLVVRYNVVAVYVVIIVLAAILAGELH